MNVRTRCELNVENVDSFEAKGGKSSSPSIGASGSLATAGSSPMTRMAIVYCAQRWRVFGQQGAFISYSFDQDVLLSLSEPL